MGEKVSSLTRDGFSGAFGVAGQANEARPLQTCCLSSFIHSRYHLSGTLISIALVKRTDRSC